ncbi:unnamed protein product [Urochloa humidicola]
MARAASSSVVFSGLCVGISVAVLLCSLSQSPPAAIDGAAEAAAAQLDPAVHGMLASVATFFPAINIIHVHLRTAAAGGRRIPEVMFFIPCASVGFLHLFCMQPGPVVLAPELLRVAAAQLLPYAGAVTFYLSLVLMSYAHVQTAAGGGDGIELYPAAVEVLNTVTLAATLITGVLSSITAALVFNAK